MSYALVRPLARINPNLKGLGAPPAPPRSFLQRLFGLGTVMDADILTSAWYLPLVERLTHATGERDYSWAPMKYLSNWDALNYNADFTQFTPATMQAATLYQWDGSQWRKTNIESNI
jgi:hypothetical protein